MANRDDAHKAGTLVPAASEVTLDTGYMIPDIENCRHIRIRYTGDPRSAGATVQFDRNSTSPNAFGDIGVSTRIYFAPRPAIFALLQVDTDKHLYSVTVSEYHGPALRLVLFGEVSKPVGGRLLVVNDQATIQNIYPLQPLTT